MATPKKTSPAEAKVNAEFDALEAADKAAEKRKAPSDPVKARIKELEGQLEAGQAPDRVALIQSELRDLQRQLAG